MPNGYPIESFHEVYRREMCGYEPTPEELEWVHRRLGAMVQGGVRVGVVGGATMLHPAAGVVVGLGILGYDAYNSYSARTEQFREFTGIELTTDQAVAVAFVDLTGASVVWGAGWGDDFLTTTPFSPDERVGIVVDAGISFGMSRYVPRTMHTAKWMATQKDINPGAAWVMGGLTSKHGGGNISGHGTVAWKWANFVELLRTAKENYGRNTSVPRTFDPTGKLSGDIDLYLNLERVASRELAQRINEAAGSLIIDPDHGVLSKTYHQPLGPGSAPMSTFEFGRQGGSHLKKGVVVDRDPVNVITFQKTMPLVTLMIALPDGTILEIQDAPLGDLMLDTRP